MSESLLDRAFGLMDHIYNSYYYSIIIAVIIALVGFIIGKVVGRFVQRTLHSMDVDAILKRATQSGVQMEKPLATVTSYFIYAIAIIMALNQLNVTTTILQMIIGAIILVGVIALAFAVKDFIPNAMAGFYLLRHKVIEEGQAICVRGIRGKVIAVTLIETKLQTKDGDVVHIPNASITKSEIVLVKGDKKKAKR